jgi:quinolinate synthase
VAAAARPHPGCKVAVHPECPAETVQAADGAGSTSFLIRYCQEGPEGATLVIGTEEALVDRLTRQYAGRKTVLPLRRIRCVNMAKTTPARLADLLDRLESAKPVRVPEDMARDARLALQRMLNACA